MSSHESRVTSHGFFVTGTDTGVGKTLVACALLHAFAARGLRVVGMKPVAAGAQQTSGRLVNDDVTALKAASSVIAAEEIVNPYCFAPPIAPHIAAARARVSIDPARVKSAFEELARSADLVIVEGAGGFRVPLGRGFDTGDLAALLGIPVILVVGMRLGCLNHALLTTAAIRNAGLTLAGWVANHIDPAMAYADENVEALEQRLPAPLIARLPYCARADARDVAQRLHIEPLR